MATVTSKNKAEFDKAEMAKRAGASTKSPLDKHINQFREKFESSEPQQSRYKRGNAPIDNMKHVELNEKSTDHDEIFNHLKSMGYKKTGGYDSEPNKFTSRYNSDEMTTTTDPMHHPEGVHAHVEHEHKGKPKVHFYYGK
jgi:hypothetical protein